MVLILLFFMASSTIFEGILNGSVGKESTCKVGDTRDMGSISELGRSPGGGHGNPLQYSWKISWTEEPGGLQSKGSQGVGHDWATKCSYRWLVNKRNLLLTVLYAGRPRSEGQHSQVLGRTLVQVADCCHLVSSHCRAQRKETSSLMSF